MSKGRKKILGQKFGMLSVLHDVSPAAHLQRPKNRHVLCQCDCGRKTSVRVDHLRNGNTRSCGCRTADVAFERAMRALESGDMVALDSAGGQLDALRDTAARSSRERAAQAEATESWAPKLVVQTKTEQRHGLPAGVYASMLAAQHGVCAICEQHQVATALAVDHCHTTGKIRGLLCTKCNAALGLFQDSIMRMARAMKYLADAAE